MTDSQFNFPSNPTVGQEYVANNTVTYTWTGDRWSSAVAIENGKIHYVFDGGYADSTYNSQTDKTLDGGGA